MKKNISLIILAVLLVLAGGALAEKFPRYGNLLGGSTVSVAPASQKSSDNLPVPFSSKAVTNVQLNYNFIGIVKSLNGQTLILTSPEKFLPNFTLTSDTKISKVSAGGNQTPASASDLKMGLNVGVVSYYDVQQAQWHTTNVFITQ